MRILLIQIYSANIRWWLCATGSGVGVQFRVPPVRRNANLWTPQYTATKTKQRKQQKFTEKNRIKRSDGVAKRPIHLAMKRNWKLKRQLRLNWIEQFSFPLVFFSSNSSIIGFNKSTKWTFCANNWNWGLNEEYMSAGAAAFTSIHFYT